ncbi:MAG TPA: NAD(P)-dependent oxidoreductase [Candidatus Binataceae bacterium]|nr:NAD(P)-dependent oxidoreductase [Candidatus Binataceae bacterium]
MRDRVLATFPLSEAALSRLKPHADVTVLTNPEDARFSAALAEADGMLITPRIAIDADLLRRAPKLRVISTHSVGLDHIDLEAAEARGIAVGHTPVLTDAVADLVLTMILMLARRIPEALEVGRSSTWQPIPMGLDLRGKNLFIIGFGRIGQEVARRPGLQDDD